MKVKGSEELTLDGETYTTYEDYVAAKRRRNVEMLQKSGLLEAKHAISASIIKSRTPTAPSRGIKRVKKEEVVNAPRRKSGRLAGKEADHIYVERETGQGVEISGSGYVDTKKEEDRYYGGRMNDGSDLSAAEAASFPKAKWLSDTAVDDAVTLLTDILPNSISQVQTLNSPDAVVQKDASFIKQVHGLQIDDVKYAAKVTPERIYSVCFHPSPSNLIGCAGDKVGNIGIWNVNAAEGHAGDGVSLFKPHAGAVANLEWNASGTSLFSLSYDSTVRELDVESQTFQTIFATYDSSDIYKNQPGYDMDFSRSWLQYGCLDKRNEQGYFISTSYGDVLHLDLRSKNRITFQCELDEKKINTVSLHPNGHNLITAGLSRKIQLFDIRKFSSTTSKENKPIASQTYGKSVNSAFFSPSGSKLLATTMDDYLEIYDDYHLEKKHTVIPHRRIKHDNRTGRWLTTFQANWHPRQDTFVVGSMSQPRSIEIYNSGGIIRSVRGDVLSSVASRCCFHPSMEETMVLGGNSSGKMFLLKK